MEKKGGKEYAQFAEGFQTLDALGGGGWDLVTQLVTREATDRPSASAALAHPWFDSSFLATMTSTVDSIGRSAVKATTSDDGWLTKQIARSGTSEAGGFTEAQLSEELNSLGVKKDTPMPRASNTIAWWQSRQQQLNKGIKQARKTVKEQFGRNRTTRPKPSILEKFLER